MDAIAGEFNVCDRTVWERMRRSGFNARAWLQTERERIARETYPAHEAGESILSISARTGVDRGTLTRTMRRLGLLVRDCSAAQRARMSKLTAAERRANVAAANFVARVREIPLPEKVKRAATRTRKVGMHERELVEALRAAGIECEHQFPIGPYNVDLWLTESRVAVELYRAHPGKALMARLQGNGGAAGIVGASDPLPEVASLGGGQGLGAGGFHAGLGFGLTADDGGGGLGGHGRSPMWGCIPVV
jgi:hypothetical protein